MRLISVVGYLKQSPRLRKDKDGRKYAYMFVTSDINDVDTASVTYHVKTYDKEIIFGIIPYLRRGMKIIATGQYKDEITFVMGAVIYSMRVLAESIELIQTKITKQNESKK